MPESADGLSSAEAAARLRADGPNELPLRGARSWWRGLRDVVREPMTALLLACGAIYVALGDRREALMLLGFVALMVGITLYQEQKTERAVEALRELASPRALVVRDGQRRRIAGREVVRGDRLVLGEGDRVAADGVVIATEHCAIDESLLTGESVAVSKRARDDARADRGRATGDDGGDGDATRVHAGTLVVDGAALVLVTATGARTRMGAIGAALDGASAEDTHLQRETRRLVTRLAVIAGALSLAVTLGFAISRADPLGGVLAGLTLAMAILPNEFPVVVTVFLALGAWRLSRRRVLTRRVPAVEALGAVTVLCADKTGTLTQNRMRVERLVLATAPADGAPPGPVDVVVADGGAVDARARAALALAAWASRRDPIDPMELAFTAHATVPATWTLVRAYPLTRARLAVIQIWRTDDGAQVVACKGAPEAVLTLAGVGDADPAAVLAQVRALADDGLRVLGLARGELAPDAAAPDDPAALPLTWVGLVGLADPIRPGVPDAIAECHRAGIRVVMITGDHPATAIAIARAAGLRADQVVTGGELDTLAEDALLARVATVEVCARVQPEQKLRLVQALAARGEVVAMTGDGVNDAPALRAAAIGIAMGGRGTDVAREAADLVLLDDDFASLVGAIRTGRRIYANLQKALAYILAIHLPVLALTVIPIAAGWPLVLLPIHIAFLHLVIDPACSIVFEVEPDAADAMRRPPRPPGARLFGRELVTTALALGAVVTAVVLAAFAVAHYGDRGTDEARAFTFTILILANLVLIAETRRWGSAGAGTNRAAWAIAAGAVLTLAAALYLPPARAMFRFATLHPIDLAICAAATAVAAIGVALIGRARRT